MTSKRAGHLTNKQAFGNVPKSYVKRVSIDFTFGTSPEIYALQKTKHKEFYMLQSILIFLTPVGGIDNMPMVILLILVTCGNLISFGLLVLLWLLAQQKGWNWLYHIARFMLVSMLIGLATAFSNAIQTSFGNALGIYLSCLITGMAAGVLATIAEGIQALLNHLRPSRLVGLALFVISSGVIVILSLFIVHFLLRNPF